MTDELRTANCELRTKDGVAMMLDAKIVMAPMAGVTDAPFRLMARKFGCRFAFTEMVDANGVVHGNRKTSEMLKRPPQDAPLGAQVSGEDAEKVLYMARVCEEKGFDVIDVNAGCPARKVIKGGKGAALLKDPVKLAAIVGKLVKNLSIPVTVKIRSGWDEGSMNYVEVARAVEGEGARAICVHPRTREQMYKGKAAHDVVREVKEAVKMPVFASGNIFSPADVGSVLADTGCDGVFIARGALGRPWIFKETYDHLSGGKEPYWPLLAEIKSAALEHFELSAAEYGFGRARPRMYKHVCWYFKRYKGLNEVMKEYIKLRDQEAFRGFIERLSLGDRNHLVLG